MSVTFEWDEDKDQANQRKHGISFSKAQLAFADSQRIIYEDLDHSTETEIRYFCVGAVEERVCTVRFTYREGRIRIFGAGYWRKERRLYERRI